MDSVLDLRHALQVVDGEAFGVRRVEEVSDLEQERQNEPERAIIAQVFDALLEVVERLTNFALVRIVVEFEGPQPQARFQLADA